eukprot:Nitzschia sp. Nitz4//scaffold97_size77645//45536//47538//NITZ4_005521-RA/size77645-augustus-gene-0.78-mRNA-1//-1//CDS//3329560665//1775//frame0
MASYVCKSSSDPSCPLNCTTLEECNDCGCVVVDTNESPAGNAADVILCLLPIAFLLFATLKKNPLPTTVSLPFAAFMLFMIRAMYLGSDPWLLCASVVSGFHEALSPLAIMTGAIFLFETMESTLCLPYMLRELKLLSQGHPVAELMLLFAFAYMVEGAAGFGTPAALGAPMLASLGHDKLDAVVCLLMMNTFATVWGAVGTPIWFGFGTLGITEDDFQEISYKAGVALFMCSFILVPALVLRVLVPYSVIARNIVFVYLALFTTTLPSLGLSFVTYEFSSLVGGMTGCLGTAILISYKVGLKPFEGTKGHGNDEDAKALEDGAEKVEAEEEEVEETNKAESTEEEVAASDDKPMTAAEKHAEAEALLGPRKTMSEGYILDTIKRTFPLWCTVLLLVLTRVEQIGLKDLLTRADPHFAIHFGRYGTFKLSASLVLKLENILDYPSINWTFALLYIPFILPFLFSSVATMLIHKKDMRASPIRILGKTLLRLQKPAVALMGALALVKLLVNRGEASPAFIIGTVLSDAFKEGWIVVACFIGCLGSFFSGSTTVSNLTFGGIQLIAAENIGTSATAMLALQAAGGSAGNGVCLNNIIAACAVVGLNIGEGRVIAKTGPMVLAFCVIATLTMLAFFFRF